VKAHNYMWQLNKAAASDSYLSAVAL